MPDLLVIMFKECGDLCADIMNQLNTPSMKKYLKESFQIDRVRELDVESDDLAGQIVMSTEDYQLPILAIVKKGSPEQVCILKHDPIEIERCVELKKVTK